MNQNQFYIGYDTLETFVSSCSTVLPLYVMLIRKTQQETPFGPGRYTYRLEVAQIRQDNAHYWMRDVAIADFYGNDVLTEHKDRANTALSALATVHTYLKEKGLKFIQACVATPKDIVLFDGGFGRMGYVQETKRFFLQPEKPLPRPADPGVQASAPSERFTCGNGPEIW